MKSNWANNAGTFTDVNDTDWYAGYIKTAVEYGLISSYGSSSKNISKQIAPKSDITRAETAVIIERLLKKEKLI